LTRHRRLTMGEADRDHVAIHRDRGVMYWALIVPSRVDTCEAQAAEMVARCETLFETFEGFLDPTSINYHIHQFPLGQQLPVGLSDENLIQSIRREIQDASGVPAEMFFNSAQISESGVRWIPRVEFSGLQVKVRLNETCVFASRQNHSVAYERDEPTNESACHDPLEVTLLHVPNNSYPKIDTEFVTTIRVTPRSDIWFADSSIGRANARHLAAFLQKIENAFPVEVIDRTSDWLPVEKLREVY